MRGTRDVICARLHGETTPKSSPSGTVSGMRLRLIIFSMCVRQNPSIYSFQMTIMPNNSLEVEKINLERFEPHKWVFEISFHCWDNHCSDPAVSFTVFVKIHGLAIEPEVTPKPKDATDGATQQ